MNFEHDAFISYRRLDGSLYAHSLRRRLLAYRFPAELRDKVPQKKLSIYIDKVYVRTTPNFFKEQIEPALRTSKHLIVVQTPAALDKDSWVEDEIAFFRGELLPQRDNVYVALARGSINDPLPAKLHEQLPNIERVNIRWLPLGIGARDALIKFVATLYDVPPELMPELHREEARRRARTAWAIATASLVLIIALAALLAWALVSSAAQRRELATSHYREAVVQPEHALAHLARALRADPHHDAARALLVHTLTGQSWPLPVFEWNDDSEVYDLAFSPDESRIMVQTESAVRFRSARDGRPQSPWLEGRAAVSPDWNRVIVTGYKGAVVFDLRTGTQRTLTLTTNYVEVHWATADEVTITAQRPDGKNESRLCDAATATRCSTPVVGTLHDGVCGTTAIVGDNDMVSLIDVRSGAATPLPMPQQFKVGHVQFSGDCGRFAMTRTFSGNQTGDLAVWDTRSAGAPLATFPGFSDARSIRFNKDASTVITISERNDVALLRVAPAGSVVFPLPSHVGDADFSANGQVLAVADAMDARTFDFSTRQWARTARHPREARAIAISADGTKLLTGDRSGITRLWDVRPGAAHLASGAGVVGPLAARFSRDGERFAVCGANAAQIYDSVTGKALSEPIAFDAAKAYIDPTLTRVAIVSKTDDVEILALATGKRLSGPVKHERLWDVAFDDSGERVATAAVDGLRLWASNDSRRVKLFQRPNAASAVAFLPGRHRLFSGWLNGALRLHDDDLKVVARGKANLGVIGLALTKTNRLLVMTDTTRIWSLEPDGNDMLHPVGPELDVAEQEVNPIAAISADGQRIALTRGKDVIVSDALRGTRVVDPLTQTRTVSSMAFVGSANEILIASGSGAALYDTEFGMRVGNFPTQYAPLFDVSANGTRLLLVDSDRVRVYDIGYGDADDAESLADLAEAVGGERVSDSGAIEVITDLPARIDRLRRNRNADPITRWFVADRATRAPSRSATGGVTSRTP